MRGGFLAFFQFLSTPPSRVATLSRPLWCPDVTGFYPRHPRGWRRGISTGTGSVLRFYPRHPRGWRHLTVADLEKIMTFLSTPPSRVATARNPPRIPPRRVSIHATLAGGDRGGYWTCRRIQGFYPRHPRGWRRIYQQRGRSLHSVSIHATLAGGDCKKYYGIEKVKGVSIHATLAGGDLYA